MDAGFEEVNHTADWEIHVWAPDLPALLSTSARGMNSLMELCLESQDRVSRRIEIKADDPESMLVNFLSELLYLYEVEQIGFDQFSIQITPPFLNVEMTGAPIRSWKPDIKAVTFHKMDIQPVKAGVSVHIVFDV